MASPTAPPKPGEAAELDAYVDELLEDLNRIEQDRADVVARLSNARARQVFLGMPVPDDRLEPEADPLLRDPSPGIDPRTFNTGEPT